MSDSVSQQRDRLLYSQLTTGSLTSVVNSSILCIAFWGLVPVGLLLGWFGVVLVVNAGRILLARQFHRTVSMESDVAAVWGRWLIASNFISGLLWGVASYSFFDPQHMTQTIILIFVLAGMTAGAGPLYAARVSAYLLFSAPALLLFALRLIQEQATIYLLMAVMTCIYLLVLWVSVQRIHRHMMETLRLRNDNVGLIEDLTRANQRIEQVNIDLKRKVAETEQAEQAARRHRDILDAIRQAQTGFIEQVPVRVLFDELLNNMIRLTDSEYGFIGEVLKDEDGQPYLRSYAMTDIAWDEDTRALYQQQAETGMEFHQLDNLFGHVILQGEAVISNAPQSDKRSGGLPQGHPPLRSFLGVPFYHGREIVGMMGMANRAEGYDQAMVEDLAPILHTCANLIHACRAHKRQAEAEQALLRERRQLQAILDNAAEGILTLDGDNQVTSINQAVRQIFQLERTEILEVPFVRLLDPDCRQTFEHYMQDVSGGGQTAEYIELTALQGDGTAFPLELGVTSIDLGGEVIRIAVLRDITERKKIERMKNDFIANVSHELRTPLTALQGALGLMRSKVVSELPRSASELLTIAENNSERLLELINDILDIERIESGRIQMEIRPLALKAQLRETLESNRQLASRNDIRVTLHDLEEDCYVNADAARLQQIMTNLLSNAVKFSDAGNEVQIAVYPGQYKIRVVVRDEGCGIPDHFKEHVFDKFSQGDNTDARQHTGSGLGLSISKALIEQMGGEIGFVSQEGKGSEFFIDLPRADTASLSVGF